MPKRSTSTQKMRERILFIPFVDAKSSERFPQLIKILSKHYDLVGVKPRHRQPYGRRRAIYIAEYVLEKVGLILRGIKLGVQNHVNVIFCEEPEYGLIGLIISKILRKPLIYDSHGNRLLLCMRLKPPIYYRFYIISLDIVLSKMSSLLLVVSEHNKRYYEYQGISPESIQIIPSFIDLSEVDKAKETSIKYLDLFKGKKTLVFSGSFSYKPNLEALQFINSELAPALDHLENVEIYICGRSSVPIQQLLGSDLHKRVTFLGFVPNIYAVLQAADVFICPLWLTVGIIVKVLDAMASSKILVTSSFLKEGIPELNCSNSFMAKDKPEFIRLVVHLLEHCESYNNMGSELRKIIERKYSDEVIEKQLCSIISNVTGSESQ